MNSRALLKKIGILSLYRHCRTLYDKISGKEQQQIRERREFYRSFINSGDVVFDIGANIGNRTQIFSELGARVIAVEPQSKCVTILKNKYLHNPNVSIEQLALGATSGTAELSVSEELTIFSTMSDRWKSTQGFGNYTEWNATETVRMDTIDSLIEKYSLPKFCKIDVEGYEKYVLSGLHNKIPYLSFEFTSIFLDDAEECLTLLSRLGTTEYNVSFGESMKLELDQWVSKEKLLVYIRKNEGAWGDIYAHTV